MSTALSPARVRDLMDGPEPVAVLDIRPKLDYTDGHIEWSVRVPRRLLEQRLPTLVPDRAVPVVLVDREGDRAKTDANWIEFLGYESVDYLDGGMAAWTEAGLPTIEAIEDVPNTAFNVPSKRFGEQVHVERDVPALSPAEFEELRSESDVVVADVRTPEEYREAAIPGAVNLEGVNLARNLATLRDDDQPVVVNCAGRTRSIIGTATLQRMGVDNVYELENGTMGWLLAGRDLEHGADRRLVDPELDAERRAELEAFADDLLADQHIPRVSLAEFDSRLAAEEVTYAVDVRSVDEYQAGHIPGTLSIPGGQAIQTTDEHFAIRPADIVFVSDSYIRAAVTAYWFAEMGIEGVSVLDGGIDGWTGAGKSLERGERPKPTLGKEQVEQHVEFASPDDVAALLDESTVEVIDVDASWRFSQQHLPGARWVDRYDLDTVLDETSEPVVLTAHDGTAAALAAAAIDWDRDRRLTVLNGGVSAWNSAGHPTEAGGPADEVRDDFEKPWHQGEEAMRAYLEWEVEMGQEFAD